MLLDRSILEQLLELVTSPDHNRPFIVWRNPDGNSYRRMYTKEWSADRNSVTVCFQVCGIPPAGELVWEIWRPQS